MSYKYAIELSSVNKLYGNSGTTTTALREASVGIEVGEFVSIVGKSGSGKTTLLSIVGLMERATSGRVVVGDKDIASLNEAQLAKLRGSKIGFVFQNDLLLPRYSALENIVIGLLHSGLGVRSSNSAAQRALASVGLGDKAHRLPKQLSGGEKQRVAVARALAKNPELLLADEPTGSLDSSTGTEIFRLLEQANSQGTTVIYVTHDTELAAQATRRIQMRDGRLYDGET